MVTSSRRARSLKAVLRDVLKRSNVSGRQAAERLGVSPMRVSRWLSNKEPAPSAADVSRLLTAIDVTGEEYDRIVAMAEATGNDWLTSGPSGINPQLASVIECERDAHRIIDCAPTVMPGLLQIRSYAQAVIASSSRNEKLADYQVETRVLMRVGRAEAITRRRAPVEFTALIGLPAITGSIGGPKVMADQLAHIADMATLDNVTIQAVDLSGDWNPAHAGAFVIYEFDDEQPPTVYLEHMFSGAFLVETADVAAYQASAESLRREAMSPADTLELIASVIPADTETE